MSEQDFLKAQLFGKLTASATHEFQNVLAIIRESSGLMEDVLMFTPMDNAEVLEERLGTPFSTIKKQVARGVELVSCLNGFAHTTDQPRQRVDVTVLLQRLIMLSRRLATNTGVELEIEDRDKSLALTIDAMQLQLCFYSAMESLFSVLPARSTITVALQGEDALSSVTFSAAHPDHSLPPDLNQRILETPSWEILMKAVGPIGITPEATGTGVTLLF